MLNPLSSKSAFKISISVVLSSCFACLAIRCYGDMPKPADIPLPVVSRRTDLGCEKSVDHRCLAKSGLAWVSAHSTGTSSAE